MTAARVKTGLAAITALCLAATAAPAFGGVNGRVARTMTANSGSWGAAGAPTNGSPTIGSPITLTFLINLLGITPQYFKVVNTGSLDLTAQTYTTTTSGGPQITLTACVGGSWNTLAGTCPGTSVSLGTSGGVPKSANVPLPVGSSVGVQAKPGGLVSLLTTATINVSVSRDQAGAATTTNS